MFHSIEEASRNLSPSELLLGLPQSEIALLFAAIERDTNREPAEIRELPVDERQPGVRALAFSF